MFYQNEISPMFLHNISPTLLALFIFFIKAFVGWVGYYSYERYKKDEFNHQDKIP